MREYGTLTDITADTGMLLDITRGSLRLLAVTASSPLVPGGGGNTTTTSGSDPAGVLGTSQTGSPTVTTPDGTVPSSGGVLDQAVPGGSTGDPSSADPGGSAGSSGGSGGGSSGGSGGRLPFTGLAVMAVAAIGAAATGTGVALRRLLRPHD